MYMSKIKSEPFRILSFPNSFLTMSCLWPFLSMACYVRIFLLCHVFLWMGRGSRAGRSSSLTVYYEIWKSGSMLIPNCILWKLEEQPEIVLSKLEEQSENAKVEWMLYKLLIPVNMEYQGTRTKCIPNKYI